MKRIINWILIFTFIGVGVASSVRANKLAGLLPQTDNSIQEFWQKFSAAVIKGDKVA